MRNNLRERACGGRGGERNRSGSGALRRAVFETIAGGGGAPFERLEAPAPLLASASAVMSDPFGETVPATVESAELSFLQSPTFGAGGGLPYNLVLGAVAPGAPGDPDTPFTPNTPGDPGGNPGPLPPDITPVPLPAAAPLLLTGAIGLFAAGSRRKKASA